MHTLLLINNQPIICTHLISKTTLFLKPALNIFFNFQIETCQFQNPKIFPDAPPPPQTVEYVRNISFPYYMVLYHIL